MGPWPLASARSPRHCGHHATTLQRRKLRPEAQGGRAQKFGLEKFRVQGLSTHHGHGAAHAGWCAEAEGLWFHHLQSNGGGWFPTVSRPQARPELLLLER